MTEMIGLKMSCTYNRLSSRTNAKRNKYSDKDWNDRNGRGVIEAKVDIYWGIEEKQKAYNPIIAAEWQVCCGCMIVFIGMGGNR
jgi:hypothetical protein